MVRFEKHTLHNGLRVIVHRDSSTPLAAFNLLYGVGSRNEHPDHTGFAHLFEHLMFGGSEHAPSFDEPLQLAGGESNAFTSNDITNYYMTLPAGNLETAFWLESDRMFSLNVNHKSLEVQRQVVVEEFRQRYLNQPYGDAFLLLRPLAYQIHPYRWPVIGRSEDHIMKATMEETRAFYDRYYAPDHAVLSVTGNVDPQDVFALSEKWFGPARPSGLPAEPCPEEPLQNAARCLTVRRDVPSHRIYKAFHAPSRLHSDYYAADMLSDVLSHGKSSRLYQRLTKEQALFSDIHAYITGDTDPGLLLVTGTVADNIPLARAEEALDKELALLCSERVEARELEKLRNKYESTMVFERVSILQKAMQLAYYEWLGSAADLNLQVDRYRAVSSEQLLGVAGKILSPERATTVYYLSQHIAL